MTARPPSPAEAMLREADRNLAGWTLVRFALLGTVGLAPLLAFIAALLIGAATDTHPDFASPALLWCLPLAVAFLLANRWLLGRVIAAIDRRAAPAPPPLPPLSQREPDSA